MHTAEDTLLPGSISTHAAKAFPSSIYKLKAEGRKHKNIPLPTPGVLRKYIGYCRVIIYLTK
jgi:hypothetical protein